MKYWSKHLWNFSFDLVWNYVIIFLWKFSLFLNLGLEINFHFRKQEKVKENWSGDALFQSCFIKKCWDLFPIWKKNYHSVWELIFILLWAFCPHLGSFCVVSSFTMFRPNFPLAFFRWFTANAKCSERRNNTKNYEDEDKKSAIK